MRGSLLRSHMSTFSSYLVYDLMYESVIKSELARNRPLIRCKQSQRKVTDVRKEEHQVDLRKQREARIPHLSVSLCKIKVPLIPPHSTWYYITGQQWQAPQAFVGRKGFNHLTYRCVWANFSLKNLTCFIEHLSFFSQT